MPSNDVANAHNLGTVASSVMPLPATIASAATIAPSTFLSIITGTTAIATITPPIEGAHLLCFIFTTTTPAAFTTSGNIKAVTTPATNLPHFLVYNPIDGKYYGGDTTT